MFKLYRRPGGKVWHYRGTVSGRRIRGSTETEDKARAQRIAAEAEARAWQRRLDGPGATLSFADCAIEYRKPGRSARFLVKVEDAWRDTLITDITAGAIRRAAIRAYPTAGPATRNRQFIVPTAAIINFAAENEWCPPIRMRRFKVDTKIKQLPSWHGSKPFSPTRRRISGHSACSCSAPALASARPFLCGGQMSIFKRAPR